MDSFLEVRHSVSSALFFPAELLKQLYLFLSGVCISWVEKLLHLLYLSPQSCLSNFIFSCLEYASHRWKSFTHKARTESKGPRLIISHHDSTIFETPPQCCFAFYLLRLLSRYLSLESANCMPPLLLRLRCTTVSHLTHPYTVQIFYSTSIFIPLSLLLVSSRRKFLKFILSSDYDLTKDILNRNSTCFGLCPPFMKQ